MDLDSIQDIDILKNLLKELMCKCIKEIELKDNQNRKIKALVNHWYYFEYDREFDVFDISDENGYSVSLDEYEFEDYFENEFYKESW